MYLETEWEAVLEAERNYLRALKELQESCEHEVILMHKDSGYIAHRICENCGYHESSAWDSGFRYKDRRLLKRYYSVSWQEYYESRPKVQERDEHFSDLH